jgi:streptogramin lyase
VARPTGRERRAEARRIAEERRAAEQGRRRHGALFVVTVISVVAIGVVVGLSVAGTGGPGANRPDATVRPLVKSPAADVVVANGKGWVLDDDAGTIRSFDPASGRWLGRATAVGTRPVAVVAGYGQLWVADAVSGDLVAVSSRTGQVVGPPVAVGKEPVSVATGEGGVWVASLGSGSVSLVDPHAHRVVASTVLPDGAVRVATGAGAVWVTGLSDTLTRVSPAPQGGWLGYRVLQVGQGPIGLTTSKEAVWVADTQDGTVQRVEPRRLRITATYHVGGDPLGIAVFDGRVWVGDGQSGAVTALDEVTGRRVGAPVRLAGMVRRLVASGGSLLAGTANPGSVVRITPS